MIIENNVDADVPAEFAYAQLTDLRTIAEHSPSSITFRSTSGDDEFVVGSKWRLQVVRGVRKFTIDSEVTEHEAGKHIHISSASNRISSKSVVEITPTSETSCQIQMKSTLSPKGILGRILVQSLKASQRRLNDRLERVSDNIAEFLEAKYNR